METLLALIVGLLTAIAIYLILQRNLLRMLFGLIILSNVANLVIFTAGGVTRASPPLIEEGQLMPVEPFANPLPQALILTAIVIGFGLIAFALVLVFRAYRALGTIHPDELIEPLPVDRQASSSVAAEPENV
jgi:multicomponent Na+:H+ antiporter subunit C